MATPLEVRQAWTALITMYPYFSKERTPADLKETLKLYQELLADIPGELLVIAARQHMASSKFFPTPTELRDPLHSLLGPRHETALEAWGSIHKAAAKPRNYYDVDGNFYGEPTFDNPITQRLVDAMGGIDTISKSDNPTADRARFIEAYNDLVLRESDEVRLLPETRQLRTRLQSQIVAPLVKQLAGVNSHANTA